MNWKGNVWNAAEWAQGKSDETGKLLHAIEPTVKERAAQRMKEDIASGKVTFAQSPPLGAFGSTFGAAHIDEHGNLDTTGNQATVGGPIAFPVSDLPPTPSYVDYGPTKPILDWEPTPPTIEGLQREVATLHTLATQRHDKITDLAAKLRNRDQIIEDYRNVSGGRESTIRQLEQEIKDAQSVIRMQRDVIALLYPALGSNKQWSIPQWAYDAALRICREVEEEMAKAIEREEGEGK